jgi:glycosyltransferase involved in cell wall biosynthesis
LKRGIREAPAVLSIVTPAFNEAENLPVLYSRLHQAMEAVGEEWEWIVVDDHSRDATFQTVLGLADKDARVRGLRLSRNFGSHAALLCGLSQAVGDVAICMSGDGQDPPESVAELLGKWKDGAEVVWAVREARQDAAHKQLLSNLYWAMMRNLSGLKETPAKGADFFLIDRKVINALKDLPERNMSVLALITWMGFRQERVDYIRQKRLSGQSGWTLAKQVKFAIDSLISFSYLPIRAMALVGAVTAVIGLLYAPYIILNAFFGHPTQGWSELMTVILILGGLQMLMLSILGEYLWRTLEETRGRPRYIIAEATPRPQTSTSNSPSCAASRPEPSQSDAAAEP